MTGMGGEMQNVGGEAKGADRDQTIRALKERQTHSQSDGQPGKDARMWIRV